MNRSTFSLFSILLTGLLISASHTTLAMEPELPAALSRQAQAPLTPLNWQLIHAAKRNDTTTVTLLLAKGANTEARDINGDTPLIIAARYWRSELAQQLLKANANIEARNNDGETALIMASGVSPVNAVMYSPLRPSAVNDDTVVLLLEAGADVNAIDQNGMTPLMHAARCGNCVTTKNLLMAGADSELKNNEGRSAQQIAARQQEQYSEDSFQRGFYEAIPHIIATYKKNPPIKLVRNEQLLITVARNMAGTIYRNIGPDRTQFNAARNAQLQVLPVELRTPALSSFIRDQYEQLANAGVTGRIAAIGAHLTRNWIRYAALGVCCYGIWRWCNAEGYPVTNWLMRRIHNSEDLIMINNRLELTPEAELASLSRIIEKKGILGQFIEYK